MKTQLLYITPQNAEIILASNTGNRKVKNNNVTYWEKILKSGDYQPTHQGIAIKGDTLDNPIGLIDGQHRLIAIKNTGITTPLNVTFGVSQLTFENIDCGSSRSLKDRTGIHAKELQVITFIINSQQLNKQASKPSTADVSALYARLQPYMGMRSLHASTRGLSVAGIRSAFVLYSAKSGDHDLYHHYIKGSFEILPPALCALYRRAASGSLGGGQMGMLRAFALSWRCLNNQTKKAPTIPSDLKAFVTEAINTSLEQL